MRLGMPKVDFGAGKGKQKGNQVRGGLVFDEVKAVLQKTGEAVDGAIV